MYGIAVEYQDSYNVHVYYGKKNDVISFLKKKTGENVYGSFYQTHSDMINQLSYLQEEKGSAIKIHKLTDENVA